MTATQTNQQGIIAKTQGTKAVSKKQPQTIKDYINAMSGEIAKALPQVMTPERFTRIALSAVSNTPKLGSCTPQSFLGAMMNAAQLGLEPNTPLGQAYLIPFENRKKGITECQFQIGYKGLLDLVYRNEMVQTVQAQVVYENDELRYVLGLNGELTHIPRLRDRGKPIAFYALFKLDNGGYGFEVMSKEEMDEFATKYSKGISSAYSPWKTNYEDMAKKTVIKKVLKYAPLKTDFQRALSNDETIKTQFAVDMSEVEPEEIIDMEEGEVLEAAV